MAESIYDKLVTGVQTTVIGMGVVFLVLIALSLIIVLQSRIIAAIFKVPGTKDPTYASREVTVSKEAPTSVYEKSGITSGDTAVAGLKDTKTAAVIMAAVSQEVNIPLSRLKIKSIRKIEKQ